MKIVDISTDRRVTIFMITLAVVVFGFVSVSRLKQNLLPDLAYPTTTVRTELEGAAPQEIETLITKPIEESVGTIKGLRTIRSVSRTGQSDVTLEFSWGTNMDYAGVDIREKLDLLELPLDAERPLLLRFDPSTEPIMRFGLVRTTGVDESSQAVTMTEADLKALRRYADEQLIKEMEAVEGVAAVKVSGGLEDEIQILVDQEKLAQLQIPIEQVAARLRAENVNLSGGRLEDGNQQFLVRTINEFRTIEEISNSIIATGEGKPIYVKDIAEVRQGFKEREAVTRINGLEAVEIAIYKEGDANTVTVAQNVERRLGRAAIDSTDVESIPATGVRAVLPENTELVKVYDQSVFISQAISEVVKAALLGGILAALVLYFFLRSFLATLIISVAIPVSVVGTFIAMFMMDISLNIMSLGGIALAVGLLVDNAIVALENIFRYREQGSGVVESARAGTGEVGGAIFASTLTTIAVFFPLVFVEGIAGQLFRDQAWTITFALLFSLLIALSLVPMLSTLSVKSRHNREDIEAETRERPTAKWRITRGALAAGRAPGWGLGWLMFGVFWAVIRVFRLGAALLRRIFYYPVSVFQSVYTRLDHAYFPVLGWSLQNRGLVLGIAALAFAATMAMIPTLGVELIPQLSQGEIYADIRLTPGTPLESTDKVIKSVDDTARELDIVDKTYSVAGTGNRLDANPAEAGENTGRLNLVLKEGSNRDDEEAAIAALRKSMANQAGVEYKFGRPELFSFSTPLEIEIIGYNLNDLRRVSNSVVSRMENSDRFADIKTTVEEGHPEIQIHFDHERAARLGLVVSDIADRVVAKVRGNVATRYSVRDRKIDVLVRNKEEQRASIEEIRRIIVNPQSDHPVRLESVAEVLVATGPSEIRRLSQERVAIVSANLNYGDLGAAVQEIDTIIASTSIPVNVVTRVTGQNEAMESSFKSMQFALALSIFLVYLVMASQFESLLHPFVILFTIPLALVGAVLALLVTGTTISVVVFIGLMMLAGIVVNNAIVLVDMINKTRARGLSKHEAIMEAGHARLRPIIMTMLTTVLGLLPMAIGLGEGGEIRAPMAITVIGGLLVATLLTLLVIPVMYSVLDRTELARTAVTNDTGNLELHS